HAVGGAILLPGTAFLELALRAAGQFGLETVEELTLEAPLVLAEGEGIAIQVSVSAAGEDGGREIAIHSRPTGAQEALGEEVAWTCNARGSLSARVMAAPTALAEWPPAQAEPIAVDDCYDRLGALGLEYGAAFRGLRAAWREGEEIYAEVSLPEEVA